MQLFKQSVLVILKNLFFLIPENCTIHSHFYLVLVNQIEEIK